jgi:hypothetical protein
VGRSLSAKPDKIKQHNQGQAGDAKHKEESQGPVSSQKMLKAQIARPYLEGDQDNNRAAKEEGIFQDQKRPPPLTRLRISKKKG